MVPKIYRDLSALGVLMIFLTGAEYLHKYCVSSRVLKIVYTKHTGCL